MGSDMALADRVRQATSLVELMDGTDREDMLKVIDRVDDEQRRLMDSADRQSLKHEDAGGPRHIATSEVLISHLAQARIRMCLEKIWNWEVNSGQWGH